MSGLNDKAIIIKDFTHPNTSIKKHLSPFFFQQKGIEHGSIRVEPLDGNYPSEGKGGSVRGGPDLQAMEICERQPW